MRVVKFGGSSVGSVEALEKIVNILAGRRGIAAVAVVSAFSGVTDALIEMGRKAAAGDSSFLADAEAMLARHNGTADHFFSEEGGRAVKESLFKKHAALLRILDGISVLGELSPRSLDLVMSFGEQFSAELVTAILSANGVPASALDTREVIKTNNNFGRASVLEDETFPLVRARVPNAGRGGAPLIVATGFIASTLNGTTTTLGRGGSDLSAAVFGAALGANEVEIWTDVDGILTADPRQVKNAFPLKSISYEEAMELSHFGAKVIFPPTIRPALERGIPIRIKNTFNPGAEGTLILKDAESGAFPIRGISSMSRIALVRVQGPAMVGVAGFSSRLFGALARRNISVILITQSSSEFSICFAVLPVDTANAEAAIAEEFAREIADGAIDAPVSENGLSIIAVVGAGMKRVSGVSGKFFHALGRNGVNVAAIAQGSSETNISAVISRQDESKALNAVHEAFFLAGTRSVNLFLIGTGLIGGTLLEQIQSQKEILEAEHKIRINLAGAADSRRMIFDPAGILPGAVKSLLKEAGAEALDLSRFIEKMKALNLPNSAFCDCTASDEVSLSYAEILKAAIPVITPNKRANSGALDYYFSLKDISRERGIPYLYETTVCAGLPVISTLRDLALSGDRIRRIEAVLSGTLSFIFNNFDGTRTFSALVREAKTKGYTEPDPRDDLNAMDAARKALILARECGMPLEFSSVEIEPILPDACFAAADVDAFFTELEKADSGFEARRAKAGAKGNVLRYVAVIEEGRAKLSLREENAASPFRSLTDSDNIVVITTDRYSKLPMVIKGPGAGAQVTAGGVFADIVRIAKTLV